MGKPEIDLNSDLGEGCDAEQMERDEAILSVVSSANVACGFHAGSAEIMGETVRNASKYGVSIGAHISYLDREGFGRRDLDVPAEKLKNDLAYQIGALRAIAAMNGARVSYVKPHGALYNRIAYDEAQAQVVAESIAAIDPELSLLTLPDSAAMHAGQKSGIRCVAEGFADRAYTSEGRLVPRHIPGSVIVNPGEVVQRALQMASDGTVTSVDGKVLKIGVRSISLHSDTEGSASLSRQIRSALEKVGVRVAPFAT